MKTIWNPYEELSKKTRTALAVSAFLSVLLLWTGLCQTGWFSSYQLPTPWAVFKAFTYLAWDGHKSMLMEATMASMTRVFSAGVMVIFVGVPLGILLGSSSRINAFFSPLLDPLRSAPVVAFLPLFVIWLGIGESMKISFLFIGAVVYLIPMVRDAVKAVPKEYWMVARDIGGTPWECITKSVVPMAMPRIMDACIVSVSLMWTYITVAEYVNAGAGLGQLIQNARRFSAMDQVFVGIGMIVVVALLSHQAMTWIKKKFFDWDV